MNYNQFGQIQKPANLYIKKMLGDFMMHCFFTVRTDEADKLFADI